MSNKANRNNSMANPAKLSPRDHNEGDTVRVVIETPKGSRNKYAFNEKDKVFELKKVLPAGMTFPTISVLSRAPKPQTATRWMYWS